MPEKRFLQSEQVQAVRYGENPQQQSAGLFRSAGNVDPLGMAAFDLRSGNDPSYNNYVEVDRLLQTMTHIAAGLEKNELPIEAIMLAAKHGNACGASLNEDPWIATQEMLQGDPIAVSNGLVMTNTVLDASIAYALRRDGVFEGDHRVLDAIIAPNVEETVLEGLRDASDKVRVFTNLALGNLGLHSLDTAERSHYVRGGMLFQENYTYVPKFPDCVPGTTREIEDDVKRDLVLAWAIGATSTSNTITLVNDGMLIGNGAGQPDRMAAIELAFDRAVRSGHSIDNAVAYSDSFLRSAEEVEVLADFGISSIFTTVNPASNHDIFEAFREEGVDVYTVSEAEGRGFFGN